MHDNGERAGVTLEECSETLIVLYHMAKELKAQLELTQVSLGTWGYCMQCRVVTYQIQQDSVIESFEPEVEAFMGNLKMFDMISKSHQISQIKQQRSVSADSMAAD